MRIVFMACLLSLVGGCSGRHGSDGGSSTEATDDDTTSPDPDLGGTDNTGDGDGDCETPGPDGSCSVWCQDCPDAQKCMPTLSGGTVLDATACVDIDEDPGGVGDPCERDWDTGVDDCGGGLMCWDIDSENGGFCAPFCTGTPEVPVCDADLGCLQFPPTFAEAPVCLQFCDPVVPAACGSSLSCLPSHPECTPPGCFPMQAPSSFFCLNQTENTVNQPGFPCDGNGLCRDDMLCAPHDQVPDCTGDDPGCCTPLCDLNAPDCAQGTCEPVFQDGAAPSGLEHVGACLTG